MRHLIGYLNAKPCYVGLLGTVSSWFTVDRLQQAVQHALPFAQLFAILVAGFVSVCSGVLIAPKALAMIRSWFTPKPRDLFDE